MRLVRAATGGDRDAFGRLVRAYLRPAVAIAWEYTASLDAAEDVAQEAFIRAFRALDSFDPGRPFGPWFFTILRNVGRDHAVAEGRRDHVPIAEDMAVEVPDAEEHVERIAFRARVSAAAELLPPMQRACFRLRDMEGFEVGEVAEMLGIAPPTVRVHVFRARRAIRAALEAPRLPSPGVDTDPTHETGQRPESGSKADEVTS